MQVSYLFSKYVLSFELIAFPKYLNLCKCSENYVHRIPPQKKLTILQESRNTLQRHTNTLLISNTIFHAMTALHHFNINISVGKQMGENDIGSRRDDNIKTEFKNIGCVSVEWIHLAEDIVRWLVLIKEKITSFIKVRKFLTSLVNISS
jgi:hypothetical protein